MKRLSRVGSFKAVLAVVAAMSTGVLSGVVTTGTASAATSSAAKAPITLGYIGDLTGVAASSFADGAGAARARIDAQNARGGVDGHKLKLIVVDDQSSPTEALTAAQDLISRGVFGIIEDSAFIFGADHYLAQQGIPVTGGGFDGPEWGTQPFSNFFTFTPATSSTFGGKYYTYTYTAKFLRDIGVTRLAGLAYTTSSSTASIHEMFDEAHDLGGPQECYSNYSVPFGTADFTADVLQIKSSHCNGVVGSFVDTSDVAMAQAIKNAGLDAKQLYFTGYDNDVTDNPGAARAMDGAYVQSPYNFTTPNAATRQMLATLKKYDHFSGVPDIGIYDAYLATDLMIYGLEHAGKNPTRASFIKNLRSVGSYNDGGILPSPVTFKHFGTVQMLPKTFCNYFVQLQGTTWHVYQNRPICGTLIPSPSA